MTQYAASRTEVPHLLDACDSCGKPGVLYLEDDGCKTPQHYCPTCTQRYALYSESIRQLTGLARLYVGAWLRTWGTIPGAPDIEEHFRHLGAELQREYEAGAL